MSVYDIQQLEYNDIPSTSIQYPVHIMTYKINRSTAGPAACYNVYPNKRYTFLHKLSNGSESKLYIAYDNRSKKNVIIKKILKVSSWKEELSILNYISEARNTPLGQEARLLKLVDFFESHTHAYIVTEYYDKLDIFEHMAVNKVYPLYYGTLIIKKMAQCIKECHDIGIVHLDIKCENFIVKSMTDTDIELILIDFGHSEILDPESSDKIFDHNFSYGTNYYLCPEGQNRQFSKKSDIWSLGICAFLILTGSYPFDTKIPSEKYCVDVLERGYKTHNVHPLVIDFVNKCLNFNPMKRSSIEDLLKHSLLNMYIAGPARGP
jgi:calcium-dependent protein kinase